MWETRVDVVGSAKGMAETDGVTHGYARYSVPLMRSSRRLESIYWREGLMLRAKTWVQYSHDSQAL